MIFDILNTDSDTYSLRTVNLVFMTFILEIYAVSL